MGDIKGSSPQNGQNGQNGQKTDGVLEVPPSSDNSGSIGPSPSTNVSAKSKKNSKLASFKAMRQASRRPLPTERGDGSYREVAQRPTLRDDLKSFGMDDIKTLKDIIMEKVKGETLQDDKTYLMERTIRIVAGLPNHSKTQEILTNSFIDKLWYSLEHPPLIYVGPESKYRRPDGKGNNPTMPELGAVGHTYARSCKPKVTQLGAQPDPEAVYEAVMARGVFKRNPNNVSSILWYWATIIIHDLFRTDMQDPNKNNSSSYLDLAPLYGSSQEELDSIRTWKDGKMKPDTFADKRLIGNPPGVCAILVFFNRFHNHVATSMAEINEGGRFTKPASADDAAGWKKYDEELFQTARLVTSGLYINITLIDYVRNIINLNRVDSTWTLDPRQEMGVAVGTKDGSDAGVGNVVSAEFNLCYRWHSCISEMDDKWIQDFYNSLLGEHQQGDMSLGVLMQAVKKFEMSIPKDPGERTFGGFERGADGKFSDDDLADCIAAAIEAPGGAFGARNVPRVMKPVEMLGIMRGRKWNLAGLNEFRKHFGLKAYATFEDINSDPEVAESLRNLYVHPDNVELYPGIVAEEGKTPMIPGVGIAPTYTISRVVLSDAVSLVRGDRYYTIDYHPGNLTNWGYKEASYDLNVNHGCVFYKLFIRALPNHFKANSIYAHYPMVIPSENRKIMQNLKRDQHFSWDRPTSQLARVNVSSYGAAKSILANTEGYKSNWEEGLGYLMGNGGLRSLLSGTTQYHQEQRKRLTTLLYADGWKHAVKTFFAGTAETLLAEKSYKLAGQPGRQVDVIRDVGNLAHTHFAARLFNLPIKTKDNPKGIFSELELYQALSAIFVCIFLDIDPANSFPLRQAAKEYTDKLGRAVELNVKLTTKLGIRGLYTPNPKNDPLAAYGVNLVKNLGKSGLNAYDIAWSQILPTAGAMVPNQAQEFAQAVDWYLSEEAKLYLPDLVRVAALPPTEETDALVLGYALEGIRMAGTFGTYRRVAADGVITEDDGLKTQVKAGDRVYVSSLSASKDPNHFPNPETVDPRRSPDLYIHYGADPLDSVTRDISKVALTELFRAVFRKKNLRRVNGPQGQLKKVTRTGNYAYLTEDWGTSTPFPTTMKVIWDE